MNRRDRDHAPARNALESLAGQLITSNFIFDEIVTLCLHRLGHETAVRVGRSLLDPAVTQLVRVTTDDESAAWELFGSRTDKRYSFTDCTSFVLMHRLAVRRAAALDDDFAREGFEVLP